MYNTFLCVCQNIFQIIIEKNCIFKCVQMGILANKTVFNICLWYFLGKENKHLFSLHAFNRSVDILGVLQGINPGSRKISLKISASRILLVMVTYVTVQLKLLLNEEF